MSYNDFEKRQSSSIFIAKLCVEGSVVGVLGWKRKGMIPLNKRLTLRSHKAKTLVLWNIKDTWWCLREEAERFIEDSCEAIFWRLNDYTCWHLMMLDETWRCLMMLDFWKKSTHFFSEGFPNSIVASSLERKACFV